MEVEQPSAQAAPAYTGGMPRAGEARESADALFTALYAELQRIARHELWRGGEVAGPTTLVHEAWLQISARPLQFEDRARFLAYAARTMRGLVIDRVRASQALKRGTGKVVPWFDEIVDERLPAPENLGRISDALDELEKLDEDLARVVDLKFFCGFTFAEVAAMHGVAERTVQRQWQRARLLLFRAMAGA